MKVRTFSKAEARRIILHASGLSGKATFGNGPEAVYRLIDRLGFVQLDTNYVVERAHHHVIASRVPGYEPAWLEELTAEGQLFEYFTSEAGYLPMKDFRFSLPVKAAFAAQRKEADKAELSLRKQVLDRVEREGPLMLSDFDDDRIEASTGWWDWRPAKVALENLYLDGELMITRNAGFKKIYDLPLNIIPGDIDQEFPSTAAYARFIIQRTLGALGISSVKEMLWRARRVKNNQVKAELEKMLVSGEVLKVEVEDMAQNSLYMLADQETAIELSGDAFILSPFDIVNVFRHRLRDFFDFDYQIECFVPAPKRKYGYFSLPILIGDSFVARMDAKADRKQHILMVHNLHFEEKELTTAMLDKLVLALMEYTNFNQCREVIFKKTNRKDYLKYISKQLV